MKQQISLREANQHLSRYINAVERGVEVIITRRGTPVARLIGVTKEKKATPEQEAALKSLFSANWKLGGYEFSREELYEERMASWRRESIRLLVVSSLKKGRDFMRPFFAKHRKVSA